MWNLHQEEILLKLKPELTAELNWWGHSTNIGRTCFSSISMTIESSPQTWTSGKRGESDQCKSIPTTDKHSSKYTFLWWFRNISLYTKHHVQCSSVQFSHSVVSNSVTPWITACQASLSITNSRSSLRLTSIESVMPSSHLILCRLLLLLPPIPPRIRIFSNESTLCMRWPKYWSFNVSIIPSKETPGLISFRMDWWDLLAVQGTLKSLLQHHSLKASVLRCSAFFTVQLSHPYMTTGKTIALTRRTLVGKVMSLLLNMLTSC